MDENNGIHICIITDREKYPYSNVILNKLEKNYSEKNIIRNYVHINVFKFLKEKYTISQYKKYLVDAQYIIIDWTSINYISDEMMFLARLVAFRNNIYTIFLNEVIAENFISTNDFKNVQVYKKGADIWKLNKPVLHICQMLYTVIEKCTYRNLFLYELWFPQNTKDITVISSLDDDIPLDADLTSKNYGFMDSMADKDSIVEVVKLLSRSYPNAQIRVIRADRFEPHDIGGNMVVIGGPGGNNYTKANGEKANGGGNAVCRRLSQMFSSAISYTDDCEYMIAKNKKLGADYGTDEIMIEDVGYFASLKNPANAENRVVLVHGIHTLGVVGATLIFSDHIEAEKNFRALFNMNNIVRNPKGGIDFECYFKVNIFKGEALVPKLEIENVFLLGDEDVDVQGEKRARTVGKIDNGNTQKGQLLEQILSLRKELNAKSLEFKEDGPKGYAKIENFLDQLHLLVEEVEMCDNNQIEKYKKQFEEIHREWHEMKR